MDASSVAKKTTEDNLHKIYTEKVSNNAICNFICNNWHMISFIHPGSEKRVCMFPSDIKSADAGKEVVKNLTPFKDDTEIRWNFLM